jgi:hypothetical protein
MLLSLQTAVAFVPQDSRPCHFEPDVIEFNQTLLAPYGMKFQHEWASKGRNFTFLELAEQILHMAPGPLSGPDLVIVAYALPDPHSMEKTVSSHLNNVLGGRSVSFAISEQGLAAPFTALRVADSYARSGRCRSVALFILEQATFPYPLPFVQDADLVDSGVLLFLGANRETPAGSWDLTGVCSAGPQTGLPELIRIPAGQPGQEVLVVAGPWTDPGQAGAAGPKIHRVPPGSYCTSVWLELARHHQDWARNYRTIVMCDTDPGTGLSHAVTLSRRGQAGRRAGTPTEDAHGRR